MTDEEIQALQQQLLLEKKKNSDSETAIKEEQAKLKALEETSSKDRATLEALKQKKIIKDDDTIADGSAELERVQKEHSKLLKEKEKTEKDMAEVRKEAALLKRDKNLQALAKSKESKEKIVLNLDLIQELLGDAIPEDLEKHIDDMIKRHASLATKEEVNTPGGRPPKGEPNSVQGFEKAAKIIAEGKEVKDFATRWRENTEALKRKALGLS
jgi:hypothetical protein